MFGNEIAQRGWCEWLSMSKSALKEHITSITCEQFKLCTINHQKTSALSGKTLFKGKYKGP